MFHNNNNNNISNDISVRNIEDTRILTRDIFEEFNNSELKPESEYDSRIRELMATIKINKMVSKKENKELEEQNTLLMEQNNQLIGQNSELWKINRDLRLEIDRRDVYQIPVRDEPENEELKAENKRLKLELAKNQPQKAEIIYINTELIALREACFRFTESITELKEEIEKLKEENEGLRAQNGELLSQSEKSSNRAAGPRSRKVIDVNHTQFNKNLLSPLKRTDKAKLDYNNVNASSSSKSR